MVITRKFRASATDTHQFVNSMVWHLSCDGASFWASKFMEELAAISFDREEITVIKALRDFVGAGGYGNSFEQLGHRKLTTAQQLYVLKPLKPAKSRANVQELHVSFNKPVVLLRTMDDVSLLPDGCYGLPSIPNFPLVDAIIQPDIAIQFTVSPGVHKGAASMLPELQKHLREKDPKKQKMIFVVPLENIASFRYQSDLPGIMQYVTVLHLGRV